MTRKGQDGACSQEFQVDMEIAEAKFRCHSADVLQGFTGHNGVPRTETSEDMCCVT